MNLENKTFLKILGISAMSTGITRGILKIDQIGLPEVLLNISFITYLCIWGLGTVIFIRGSKK